MKIKEIISLGGRHHQIALYMSYSNKSCRKGNGTTLQYSCLENPLDGGAW